VRLSHTLARTGAVFDDPNLVSHGGLVPVTALAERAGLPELLAGHVRPGGECGVNASLKVGCLVAGMAAGADSIDDMSLLRHGAMDVLFAGVRAPSTLGSHLRSYTWGNVLQVERAGREFLARLSRQAPLLPGADVLAFVDIDSTQKRVYGHKKEGAKFGHTKIQGKSVLVRGLNALVAAVSTPLAAPVAAATRLRGGNAPSARGAAGLAARAVATARACGCTGTVIVRMDSAYYAAAVIAAVRPGQRRHQGRDRRDPRGLMAGHRLPAGPVGRPAGLLGLRRRGRRDQLHGLHLEEEGTARHRQAHRPPGPRQEPEGGTGPGRAVPRLALPRRLHRQPLPAGPGRRAAPRPRGYRAVPSRPERRAAGAPAVREVQRQRRLARHRRHRPQPAPRRRRPGRPPPRQGPRGHRPPRPDRRRRPHRPVRPRPAHSPPARRLAPRARMAEPLRGRLRPARRSGLTSPDPVRTPKARQSSQPQPPAKAPDKPQNRQRQGKRALKALANENGSRELSRWIEAETPE